MKADKIYVVGFMAAGKTTLARALAKRLDWRAVDIDELIEQRERMAVADIFARHGEPYFRAVERAVAARAAAARGTWSSRPAAARSSMPTNRAAINADGLSVWLDAPLDRVIARLPSDGRRPLAADRVDVRAPLSSAPGGVPVRPPAPRRGPCQRRRAGRAGHGLAGILTNVCKMHECKPGRSSCIAFCLLRLVCYRAVVH